MKEYMLQVQNICSPFSALTSEVDKISDSNLLEIMEILTEIGDYFEEESDNERALQVYDIAAEIFHGEKKYKEDEEVAKLFQEILNSQIGILFMTSDLDRAEDKIVLSIDIAKKQKERIALLVPINNYGIFYFYQGKHDIALDYFNQGLEIATAENNIPAIVKALGNIGNLHQMKYEYSEAMKCYKRLISYLDPAGSDSDKRYCAICYKNIGEIYLKQGNMDRAIEFYHKRIALAEELEDKQGICIGYNSIGSAYQLKGYLNRAKIFHHKALVISEEIGNKVETDRILGNLSLIYYSEKDYEKAEMLLRKKHEVAKKLENKESFIPIYSTMGLIASEKGEYAKAVKLFTKQLRYAEEAENKIEMVNAMLNILNMYIELGRFEKGRKMAGKALKLGRSIRDMASVIAAYQNLAYVERNCEDFAAAEQYFERGLELSRKLNNRGYEAEILYSLAELNFSRGDNDKVKGLAAESLELAIDNGCEETVFNIRQLLLELNIQENEIPEKLDEYEKELENLLKHYRNKEEEQSKVASLYYLLWKLALKKGLQKDNDVEKYKAASLEKYREMYLKKPSFNNKEKIAELEL